MKAKPTQKQSMLNMLVRIERITKNEKESQKFLEKQTQKLKVNK